MKLAVDTNVLVYAHIAATEHHQGVRNYLTKLLARDDNTLVLTPIVLHEFVHIVTDSKRFDPPVTMSEALAITRLYLARSNVEVLSIDVKALQRALELLERYQLGRKRIADTLVAATCLQNNIATFLTCNTSDFTVFDELKLIDPRT